MDFGPTGKKGKKWPKNGKIGSKTPIFLFFGHFFPFLPGGAKIHFSAIFFPISGRRVWGLHKAIRIANVEMLRHPYFGVRAKGVMQEYASGKQDESRALCEIAPRVSTRWQISLLITNFSVKNVVKFWWRILRLLFLVKVGRKIFPQKSTTCFTLENFKFHHHKLLGPLLHNMKVERSSLRM